MCDVINANNEIFKSFALNSFFEVNPIMAFTTAKINRINTRYAQ
jgi:hypothetical protein